MSSIMSSIWEMMNLTKQWPVIISNKKFPFIEESSRICQQLEDLGFRVETFSNRETQEYGLKIYEN